MTDFGTANNHGPATEPHGLELFVLTDEQILGIEGPGEDGAGQEADGLPRSLDSGLQRTQTSAQDDRGRESGRTSGEAAAKTEAVGSADGKSAQPGMAVLPEAPGWLKERMKDPWHGDEARELWEGAQKAQREAGAYREVFATPEDARALKELYPGGVGEAKAAGERARELAEIDAAYFGAAGGRPEELGQARAELAQRLMKQDPAAFREMVMAGMRLLEGDGKEVASSEWRVASTEGGKDAKSLPRSLDSDLRDAQTPARDDTGREARDGGARVDEKLAAEYREFEKAANAELERSVGGVIARTMEQALPNLGRMAAGKSGAELGERLKASVREEVDAALKSDAQLGEQVAKVLAARRFDDAARAQVVRLIDARAQQLVPGAVRRVVGNWTQTAMAARRGETIERVSDEEKRVPRVTRNDGARPAVKEQSQAGVGLVNYRKLSDEEILEL